MLKEIFTSQRQFINYFFDQIRVEEAESVLAELLRCKGMLIFTGVGKSGLIAEKVAKTMMSIGTRALYLPSESALHGDIGIVSPEDVVIIISKSGKTPESLNLAANIRRRGVKLIAWVSALNTPLSRACDYTIHLPLEREICPFDLVPTTSTAVQLIFGDILAVALMRAKQFSLDEYALNHPAGAIGKLIAQKVGDVMLTGEQLPICRKENKLKEVLVELSKKRCGCLLIADSQNQLEGIFTDGDLRRALEQSQEKVLDLPMEALMTTSTLFTTADTLTSHALKLMEGEKKVMMLPVLEEKSVVGLIHLHHILNVEDVYAQNNF